MCKATPMKNTNVESVIDQARAVRLLADSVAGNEAPTTLALACGRSCALRGMLASELEELIRLARISFAESMMTS